MADLGASVESLQESDVDSSAGQVAPPQLVKRGCLVELPRCLNGLLDIAGRGPAQVGKLGLSHGANRPGSKLPVDPGVRQGLARVENTDDVPPVTHLLCLSDPIDDIPAPKTATGLGRGAAEAAPDSVIQVEPHRGRAVVVPVGRHGAVHSHRPASRWDVDAGSPSDLGEGVASLGGPYW